MRLFEAIVNANHRAAAGDATAGLRPDEFADALPIVALSCIDARLNPLLPEVLGVPESHFIWLRNAGNIITGPMSSTMRSLALACAVKGGKEIVIIGHTDCLVCKTSMMQLTDRLRALGIDRSKLPENLNEYFGLFASERQNVMKAVEYVRGSPLIGPRVPVHGLMVDIQSGRLEWIVNGYQALDAVTSAAPPLMQASGPLPGLQLPEFKIGEMKFPEGEIGGGDSPEMQKWLTQVEVVHAPTEPPPLKLAGEDSRKPAIKRKYEPKPPGIPLPKPSQTPPKLQQPWRQRPPER